MSELVKLLRDGASISRGRKINLDYAKVADEAADRITELEALLAAVKKDAAWQPIETAPKFGDQIDIWGNGERAANCVWSKPTYGNGVGWVSQTGYDSNGPVFEFVRNPTHYMPLPKSPLAEAVT